MRAGLGTFELKQHILSTYCSQFKTPTLIYLPPPLYPWPGFLQLDHCFCTIFRKHHEFSLVDCPHLLLSVWHTLQGQFAREEAQTILYHTESNTSIWNSYHKLISLTEYNMQTLDVHAPQHPKNEITKIIDPITIVKMGICWSGTSSGIASL